MATVDVLVSDPNVDSPRIVYGNTHNVVDAPSYQSVNHALQEWVDRINATKGAVGFLHWVGHGTQQLTDGGQAVVLYCDGTVEMQDRSIRRESQTTY